MQKDLTSSETELDLGGWELPPAVLLKAMRRLGSTAAEATHSPGGPTSHWAAWRW